MKKFDLTSIYHKDRPLSWSAISSFEWNKGQWYAKYVVHGKCQRDDVEKGTVGFCVVAGFPDPECPVVKKTIELIFGSYVDKRIQDDPTYLPELVRYPILQHEMRGTFNKIPLLGYADTFSPLTNFYALRDYKTGRKPWDQKRADQTGQLTMYMFMLYLRDKIKPEDIEAYIDWLPTHIVDGKIAFIEPVTIHSFKTKRIMREVLAFGQRIKDVWQQMEEYCQREQNKELTEW